MKKRPSGSLIGYFSRLVAEKGGINLAQGKPGFSPPPELLQILREQSSLNHLHQYAPGNGNFDLLNLLARHHSQHHPVSPDNFLVVQGATEGIFLSFFHLTSDLTPPCSVLSFAPVYESYPELARIVNLPFEYFDFGPDLSLDFDKLKTVLVEKNVKIVFVASPGNPLGKVWKKNELTELIMLSEKLDFSVIFDAVYIDLFFQDKPVHPLEIPGVFSQFQKLFFVGSFSKMLSITGWRVGYIIAEKSRMKKIRAIHDYTGLSAPALFQSAIAEYLNRHNHGHDYLHSLRKKNKRSAATMKKTLQRLGFTIPDIQGGYFLWARLPEPYRDGLRFALELYDNQKVGVVPGENFGPGQEDHIRINIAQDSAVVREGAEKIETFLKSG